jgi:hypothetical protein
VVTQPNPAWDSPDASWRVKVDRAAAHLQTLQAEVDAFRSTNSYTLTPEPTDVPDRLAYRLRFREFPTSISATVGDVLSNLRAALECLAYGVAAACDGGRVPSELEDKTAFPIVKDPAAFAEFFRRRRGVFDLKAQDAFRLVQSFWWIEEARRTGISVDRTYETAFTWSQLHRLDRLWNVDKHRRLATLRWRADMIWWASDGPTERRIIPGDGTYANGSILFYMDGTDAGQGTRVNHEFDIVLIDDPAHLDQPFSTGDLVDLLGRFHLHVISVVFPTIWTIMSKP